MHDDVHPLRQFLHLIGCRGSAWWREHIVACVAADHHTSSWRVYAIGRMARSMSRPDRTDFHVTGRPDDLRLVLRIERNYIGQIGWAARKKRVVLGAALGNLAGLEECIGNMRDIFPAAVGDPLGGCCIRTADYVDLWPLLVPTQHHDVGKALRVISMHVRKEDRIELYRSHIDLR